MGMKDYVQEPLAFDDGRLRLYSDFLSRYYGRPDLFTVEYLAWQYRDNPVGRAVGWDAFFKGELVAHVATIPLRALIFDREEKWLLLVNAMTVPEHRRQGISVGLADRIERLGVDLGCTFIIGIANRNSTPAYIRGRGMEWSTTLDARVGIGLPRLKRNAGGGCDFKVLWDRESLAWRLKRPGTRYWRRQRGDHCTLFAPSGIAGIKTILANFPASEVGDDFPPRRRTALPLNLWIGKDARMSWARSCFVPIPDRLRPSPLNFLFKDLSGRNRSLKNKSIFFQAVDFDVF
jgi:GNAT superfamily N-acetyltransferase